VVWRDLERATEALAALSGRQGTPKEEVGLHRVRELLRRVADPQSAFPAIHVTGSAGKGSTSVMAACLLREAGYRTGLFTGPHLSSFTERIAIDGREITPEEWLTYQNRLWPAVEGMAQGAMGCPTFFETLWAMACLYFAERGVACAVVEVGRGGRRDATTANAARVGIITNVSLEHTELLGHTLEAIAAQKAGIIKPGMTVVTAATPPALGVIAAAARDATAMLCRVADGAEPSSAPVTYGWADQGLWVTTPRHTYQGLHVGLPGRHQAANVACAIAGVEACSTLGLVVSAKQVAAGLAKARLPGRLELVVGSPDVLLDTAQSAAAVEALSAFVTGSYAGRPLTLLVAVVSDKDLTTRVPLLAGLACAGVAGTPGLVVVTEPPREGRGGTSSAVEALAQAAGAHVVVRRDYKRALELARTGTPAGGLLVVAGSTFLVGAVRALLIIPRA